MNPKIEITEEKRTEAMTALDRAVAEQDNIRLLNEFIEVIGGKGIFLAMQRPHRIPDEVDYHTGVVSTWKEEDVLSTLLPEETTKEILGFLSIDQKLVELGQRLVYERLEYPIYDREKVKTLPVDDWEYTKFSCATEGCTVKGEMVNGVGECIMCGAIHCSNHILYKDDATAGVGTVICTTCETGKKDPDRGVNTLNAIREDWEL